MPTEQTIVPAPIQTGSTYQFGVGVGIESSAAVETSTAVVKWYKMRGIDANAGTTPPTFRSWTVKDTPDYDASRFSGEYSGGSPNIVAVTIQGEFDV